jgi:outer membrane protein
MTRIPAALVAILLCLAAVASHAQVPAPEGPVPEAPTPPAVSLPPEAQPVVPTDRPLTLAEAIDVALARQPLLEVARQGLQAAKGRTEQTRSAYFPGITLGTGAQRSFTTGTALVGGVPVPGAARRYSTQYDRSLSVRQLVYDFGRTDDANRAARRNEDAASYDLSGTRADIITQVKQAYYAALQALQLQQVSQANLDSQLGHLDMASAQFAAEAAARADVVKARAAVSQAVLDLTTAQNNVAIARVQLNQLLGIDVRTPVQLADEQEAPPATQDANALVAQGLEMRPEVRSARSRLRASQALRSQAEAGWLPGISASGSLGQRGSDFPPMDEFWGASVSFDWSPVTFGQVRGAIREARANTAAARANLYDTEQLVATEIVGATLDLRAAEQRLQTAQAQVDDAQESLNLATGRYQAGVAIFLEVLDAQAVLTTAQTELVNARFDVSLSRAALLRAIGGLP